MRSQIKEPITIKADTEPVEMPIRIPFPVLGVGAGDGSVRNFEE